MSVTPASVSGEPFLSGVVYLTLSVDRIKRKKDQLSEITNPPIYPGWTLLATDRLDPDPLIHTIMVTDFTLGLLNITPCVD